MTRTIFLTVGQNIFVNKRLFLFIALEDSGLDLIVYAGDPSNPSQKYNLEANVSCPVAAFPADVENLVSGQAFGHPMACGGNAVNGKL
jgi:hypothetical protein